MHLSVYLTVQLYRWTLCRLARNSFEGTDRSGIDLEVIVFKGIDLIVRPRADQPVVESEVTYM